MEESAQIAHENLPSTALRYVKHSRNFSTKIVVEHDDNTMKTDNNNSDNKSYTTMKMAKGKRNTVILRFSPQPTFLFEVGQRQHGFRQIATKNRGFGSFTTH